MVAISVRSRPSHRGSTLPLGTPWFQRTLAVCVCVALLVALLNYPTSRILLGMGLAAYIAVGLRFPGAWLCLFPALLPVLNLASWSGRYFLEEFDLFLLATVSVALWQGLYDARRRAQLSAAGGLVVLAFASSMAIAVVTGAAPWDSLDANSFSSYYSPYNAFRVARGFFWAALLAPPLFGALEEDRERARRYLAAGIVAGLLAIGATVLWERGVFADLLHARSRYDALHSLLDFSSNYRITAMFSEMHTGGEAIDGYLALSWPFAVYGLFSARNRGWFLLSGVALGLGLYSAMVTFSRGTYIALAVGTLVFVTGAALRVAQYESPWRMGLGVVYLVGVAVLALAAYHHGGFLAMLGVTFGFAVAAGLGYLERALQPGFALAGYGIALTVPVALIVKAQLSSKWVAPTSMGDAIVMALGLGLGAFALGLLLGRLARRFLGVRGAVTLVALMATGLTVLVPPIQGSLMESRFADAAKDVGVRTAHWQQALEIMDDTLSTKLFGMGLGTFPRTYLLNREHDAGGTYQLKGDAGDIYLAMSGSQDLRFGQRIDLPAGERFVFTLDYRTDADIAMLYIRVCRRNIIMLMEYNPECRTFQQKVESTHGQWQRATWNFDIGDVGSGWANFGRRPLTLEIMNRREYALMEKPVALVDFDNLALKDSAGNNLLKNGDFSAGLDYWFPYCDFNHLPWHIKNVWVDVYFEQGLVGLATFVALILYGLVKAYRPMRQGDGFALATLAALLAFLSVGLIGTLIDVPRMMVLFYLLLFNFYPKAGSRPSQPA